MISALKAGEVDLIVALTEGLVGDIAQQLQSQSPSSSLKILGTYVESPLVWAISTGAHSAFNEVADLRGQSIGISRFTSGSHLMTCVLASQRGWAQSDVKYVVLGSFADLRAGVNAGTAAAFMWEHFTTKPFNDSGEIRRIGQIVTPWGPCFMLCSSRSVLADPVKRAALHAVQRALQDACRLFHSTPGMADEVAKRYGLRPEDAKAWYDAVRITASGVVAESTLEGALQALKDAGILTAKNYPHDLPLDHFVSSSAEEGAFVTLEADIKSMKLYHRPELLTALWNNIRVRLHKEKGALRFQELQPFDQNHYGGIAALQICAKLCALTPQSRLVQLGSSVGGPSRYFGGAIGCEVLAVELQEELSACGRELTARCGLQDRVHHLSGNFLQVAKHLGSASYDCVASWLTILHFTAEQRRDLFADCWRILKPGGTLYAEDFFNCSKEGEGLTPQEQRTLRHEVYCRYLPTLAQYQSELVAAGFEIALAEDLTAEWTDKTADRLTAFRAGRAKETEVHGESLVANVEAFYSAVAELFKGGHCGGLRILCRKPMLASAAAANKQ